MLFPAVLIIPSSLQRNRTFPIQYRGLACMLRSNWQSRCGVGNVADKSSFDFHVFVSIAAECKVSGNSSNKENKSREDCWSTRACRSLFRSSSASSKAAALGGLQLVVELIHANNSDADSTEDSSSPRK